jgi:uncharacterized protein YqjF (DUF2071 family)
MSGPSEPVTPTAPRRLSRVVLTQVWRDVAFVHWAVDPAAVAPLLPPGVRPDTLDGTTYVGLVAFRLYRTGLLGTAGLPYLGSFTETNVRLYSVDGHGRRGVVFRSMDAARLLPVLAARSVAGLPYTWARMRADPAGGRWHYTTRRRWPGRRGLSSALTLRVGDRIPAPSPLELFLTARWGLHAASRAGTVYWPTEHPEWPLHGAAVEHLADNLVAAAGLSTRDTEPVGVLWSPGVPVRFGPRQRG